MQLQTPVVAPSRSAGHPARRRAAATRSDSNREAMVLLTALRRLDPSLQAVLELSLLEGLGEVDIAELVRAPRATVRRQLWIGRQQLCGTIVDIAPNKALARSLTHELERWGRHVQHTLLAGAIRPPRH